MPSLPRFFVLLVLLVVLATTVTAVKREEFKTCSQAPFCARQREFAERASASPYSLLKDSVQFVADKGLLKADLVDERDGGSLSLELNVLGKGEYLRLRLRDANPLRPRYDGAETFSVLPETAGEISKDAKISMSEGNVVMTFGTNGTSRAVITTKPFRIQVFVDDVPVVDVNAKGLLNYERYKSRGVNVPNPVQGAQIPLTQNDGEVEKESWEEKFKQFTDSNPNGPASVGLDFSFPGSKHVYGIPEHATSFSLKSTRGTDAFSEPYRLYNLDVFEYVLDDPMALYGSIPYMVSHKKGQSAGVLWLNSAETWVDVWKETKSEFGILPSFTMGRVSDTTAHAHWYSESGQLDAFILLGPSPLLLSSQYARLTGYPALPPSFAIAYHQCRWNYMSQKEVEDVDAGFDEYDIPYDVLWLDIEHTDGKRYFTWDLSKFPEPKKMIEALAIKARKMVNIVDPHIKRDDNYYIFSEAQGKSIFVKDKDGKDFNGWCWPGSSSWIDYTNQEARDWWASKFALDQYKESTPTLYIWNDMNEPSVFSGPEITMPKDLVHHNGWEHRDVHNLYGMLFQRATSEGLAKRGESPRRPFVLSRAFFAGSQRYGAIWTGDNLARWDHLAIAAPMLLSIGIAGLPFAGADVGGFFGNPEPELLARWYQAGSFQPFFRAHAHLDTKHREPWLFGEPYTSCIRDAVKTRYSLLPLWYTLFWEASVTGAPMMRPMFMAHPDDESMFAVDDQWMVGDSLLVKPVVVKGVTVADVLLPGSQPWYDYVSHKVHRGPKAKVDAPLDKIPVFIKGGSIVPRRELVRRSSELMKTDPLTFVIAVDDQGSASGSLYLDDGETFAHQSGGYLHVATSFSSSTLFRSVPTVPSVASPERSAFLNTLNGVVVKQLVIVGSKKWAAKAVVRSKGKELEVRSEWKKEIGEGRGTLVVHDLRAQIGQEFEVALMD